MPKVSKLMKARRDRIARALQAYGDEINGVEQNQYEPLDQTIGDFLTDLMHFCALGNLDFAQFLLSAEGNFEAERGPGDDIEQDARRLYARDHPGD